MSLDTRAVADSPGSVSPVGRQKESRIAEGHPKMSFDLSQREWLAALGAVLICTLVPVFAHRPEGAAPKPPVARVKVVTNTYFGETLSDPYRWMENDKDPDWLPFMKGQNAYARQVLDGLPRRVPLLKRIGELSGDLVTTTSVHRAGNLLFFQQRPLGADNFKLFVREAGRDRVLVDPTALSAKGTGHFSLDWWAASPDGKYVAYGISKDGSEDSVLRILTVSEGKNLSETIPDTQGADPQWLDDGSGFFYNQLTGKIDTPERYLDSQVRFHRLGADPAEDPILMKRGLNPTIVFDNIQAPMIATTRGSKYAILILA